MQNFWLGDYNLNILNSPEAFQAVLDEYRQCPDEEATSKLTGVFGKLYEIVVDNFKQPLSYPGWPEGDHSVAIKQACIEDCLRDARKCDCSPAKFFSVRIIRTLRNFIPQSAPQSNKDFNWSATFDTGRSRFTIPVHPYNLPQKLASKEDIDLMILNDGSEQYLPFSRWLSHSYKNPTLSQITIHCHDKYGKSRGSVSLYDANHIEVSMIDPEYFSSSTLGMELKFKYGKATYDDEELLARYGQRREEAKAEMATGKGA